MTTDEKSQFFTATFGIDVVFNEDNQDPDIIAQKYIDKAKDIANRINSSDGDLYVQGGHIDASVIGNILGPEELDRFSELEQLINKDVVATQGWAEALRQAKLELEKIDAQNAIVGLGDNVDNLINNFLAGEVNSENIVENKDFQAINNQIDELIEKYPELTAAAEVFSNTNLVGTQMWTEALGMLQDKINEVKLDKLKDEYNKVREEIFEDKEIDLEAFLDSDTFEEDLDKLLNADYAIVIEVHSQAEQAFEETQKAMDNLKEQASKIGDNFMVSVDDIRELNNTFPGILEGAKKLNNGLVQLDKEKTQIAIANAQKAVIVDAEATDQKIAESQKEIETKIAQYEELAKAAEILKNNQNQTDEE